MTKNHIRTKLIAIVTFVIVLPIFATGLWISAKFSLLERHFEVEVNSLSEDVKSKLNSNEIVLDGFSAFLKAVDSNDSESAERYAAFVASSYPQIYMLEVARKVLSNEQTSLQDSMRKMWNKDFTLKTFSEITHRSSKIEGTDGNIWPILFMYPYLSQAKAIYGTRLETVYYLAHSLALAHTNPKQVASSIFDLYEGGKAYILLKEVNRSSAMPSEKLNFFGNTMMALLVIKTESLLPSHIYNDAYNRIGLTAFLGSSEDEQNKLFEYHPVQATYIDKLFLPIFKRRIEISDQSQPVVMLFEHQLLWDELLTQDLISMLIVILSVIFLLPWFAIRHYKAIEKAKRAYEQSTYLASHDLLTGLSNRFSFIDKFMHVITNTEHDSSNLGLMLIDLDQFKEVNDTYGHDIGDEVLVETAKRMKLIIRASDTACRYGGDEFILLLKNITDEDSLRAIGEKLRQSISEPIQTSSGLLHISCSIGASLYPKHSNTLDSLIKSADNAMFKAKKQGRNIVAVAS